MFLKNRNISSKIKISKVTDYAALNFTKFNENSMEAKSQQNFYNKTKIVVFFFKTFSLEYTLSGSCAKSHKMAHNNPLLPVFVVYSLHTVE